jgi:hypothetical protein
VCQEARLAKTQWRFGASRAVTAPPSRRGCINTIVRAGFDGFRAGERPVKGNHSVRPQ